MIAFIQKDDGLKKKLDKIDPKAVEAIVKLNLAEIYNRGKKDAKTTPGGTPIKTGELRISLGIQRDGQDGWLVGYTKEYAPAVEYGHRTKGGGYVPGRYFLKTNVGIQESKFRQDLARLIKAMGG